MAQEYGMLPTEVLQRATTVDMFLYTNARLIRIREQRKAEGKGIADTFNQAEVEDMYYKFKNRKK